MTLHLRERSPSAPKSLLPLGAQVQEYVDRRRGAGRVSMPCSLEASLAPHALVERDEEAPPAPEAAGDPWAIGDDGGSTVVFSPEELLEVGRTPFFVSFVRLPRQRWCRLIRRSDTELNSRPVDRMVVPPSGHPCSFYEIKCTYFL